RGAPCDRRLGAPRRDPFAFPGACQRPQRRLDGGGHSRRLRRGAAAAPSPAAVREPPPGRSRTGARVGAVRGPRRARYRQSARPGLRRGAISCTQAPRRPGSARRGADRPREPRSRRHHRRRAAPVRARRSTSRPRERGDLRIAPHRGAPVKLSLVVPTYNESRNLEELIGRLAALLDGFLPGAYELIVVDDDSPDQTWALALRLADRCRSLRVMRRRGEKGLSTAVVRGWQAAQGEVLAVIDGDLQHPPEVVEKLWAAIAQGADLAVGSRHAGGGGLGDWSALRRGLSRAAQLVGL